MITIARPAPTEHPSYAAKYLDATARELARQGDDNLLLLLGLQPDAFDALLSGAAPTITSHAYAPGKWTLAESLVHVCDTERVFAYRLLRIARGDSTPLPGFDHDAWVPESRPSRRPLRSLLAEFRMIRGATLALVNSLDESAISRIGTASNQPISARALTWMITGHAAHHLQIIAERYLGKPVAD